MRPQDRSATYEVIEVPVSVVAASNLTADYLPSLKLIADAELEKMGAAGAEELARRKEERQAHVKAGRVRYVYQSQGYQDRSIWVMSSKPKGKERNRQGRLEGHAVSGPHEGTRLALMSLKHYDEGGVIYVSGGDWQDDEVVDVRPNECEALQKTGQHDWSYVPTGDDVCRSCGLVT